MLLRARDNNIQSFAYTWLHKGKQNKFLKHPKIKWLDGGLFNSLLRRGIIKTGDYIRLGLLRRGKI